MSREPITVIRAAYLDLLLQELAARGKDRDALVRQFDLPRDATPDAYVALRPVLALIRWGELHTGMDLGAEAASRLKFEHFSAEVQQALAKTTELRNALVRFAELGLRELSFTRYELATDGERATIECCGPKGNSVVAFLEWLQIQSIVAVIRHFSGESWQPSDITLRLPDVPSKTAVSFPHSLLALRIIHSPRCLSPEPDSSTVAAPGQAGWNFPTALGAVLRPYFSRSCPDLELAGRITGVCSRTLQRQLRPFGLCYKDVITELRLDIAKQLLHAGDTKVIDVSYAAGYADPSHFARAFKRTVGVSPKRYSRDPHYGRRDEAVSTAAAGSISHSSPLR